MAFLKDLVFIHGEMEVDMKVILSKEWGVGMAVGFQVMILNATKALMLLIKNVGMESISGEMDIYIKAILKMI